MAKERTPKGTQTNQANNYLYGIAAAFMIIGAVVFALRLLPAAGSIVYTLGAVAFTIAQIRNGYHGTSLTLHRLRSIQILACIVLIVAGLFMLQDTFRLLPIPWQWHVRYVHNNWVVLLLIGAVLQLYTAYRMQNEEEKEVKKT